MAFKEKIIAAGYVSFSAANIEKQIGDPACRLTIPADCLYRVQGLTEYKSPKLDALMEAYDDQGSNLLNDFPLITCALPIDSDFIHSSIEEASRANCDFVLAIADGNHRYTAGLAKNIDEFYSHIYSVKAMARFYTHLRKGFSRFTPEESPEQTYEKLFRWIYEAEGPIKRTIKLG